MSAAGFSVDLLYHRAPICLAALLALCSGCGRRTEPADDATTANTATAATAVASAADRLVNATPVDPLQTTARQRLRLRTLAALDQRHAAPGFAPAPDQAIYRNPLALDRLIGRNWRATLAGDEPATLLPLRRAWLQRQHSRPTAAPQVSATVPDLLVDLPARRRIATSASRGDLPAAQPADPRPAIGPSCLAVAAGLADKLPPPSWPDLPHSAITALTQLWPGRPASHLPSIPAPATTRTMLPLQQHDPTPTEGWAWLAWLMPALSLIGLLLAVVYARLLGESARMVDEKP